MVESTIGWKLNRCNVLGHFGFHDTIQLFAVSFVWGKYVSYSKIEEVFRDFLRNLLIFFEEYITEE